MSGRAHIADAFRWSAEDEIDWPAGLAAAAGMAAPIAVALLAGRLPLGLAASLGGFLMSNARTGGGFVEHARALVEVFAAACLAAIFAILIAGHGVWTDAAMVGLASAAAFVGGLSRPLALGTGRFIVFLIITLGAAERAHHPSALLVPMALGAIWTAMLALIFGGVFRAVGWTAGPPDEAGSTAPMARKFKRWRRSLAELAGWQFTIRLAFCLVIAAILRASAPERHFLWISLIAAILSQRRLEALPIRVTQRAIGAALGVSATALILVDGITGWPLALTIALLAAVGPWLRMQNYLAYTATMTPLIVLLLDAVRPVEIVLLVDRLLATLIGAGLVIAANVAMGRMLKAGPSIRS